ncbi:SRPBCC domain-containing protein [Nostoc sp.]|uniref:SRPBCC domain-containing protein n=1 Tax=Nostoc sp. TaxID=1180 RepID=UPI002FFCB9E0
MSNKNDSTDAQSEREIVITRVFNAPRELVFKASTDPKHVVQWWGPKGFTTRVTELDLRPGGKWRYVMIGPDGTEYPAKGVFREIVPLERIVTSDEFDEGFEKVMNVDLPRGMVTTAVFEDLGTNTKLTLRIMHESTEDRRKHEEMGVIEGWNSSFDCLNELLAKA